MGSRARKSGGSLMERELRSSAPKKTLDELLAEAVENVSLKAIPLEERRKEASKPLFLTRYE
jgi:hypothetical protein